MKRIMLTLSYDGTAYHGWQLQPNAVTVQEVVQGSLERVLGVKTPVTGCSRTDAGVHAREFCLHLDCDDNIPEAAFLRGLNSVLPSDISVTGCKAVAPDFHARYSARGKTYIYSILNSACRDPFLSRYVWQIERPLSVDRMNEFCKKTVGTHNFSAFSSSRRTVTDTVRTVSECYVERKDKMLYLKITANGFLYNMVRIITGSAVAASDGSLKENAAELAFESGNRELLGITAPPTGLRLEKVYY